VRKTSIQNLETKVAKSPNKTSMLDQSGIPLEKVEQVSRYYTDFIELEKIGEGGFGHVWKARHKLDGNIYAIKKVKLSKNNSEENKRIKREVTYLSSLNSPFIVRYF
jgi:serine/threonine protein kinase